MRIASWVSAGLLALTITACSKPASADVLQDVNSRVNRSIVYTRVPTYEPRTNYGDCKTYDAEKRKELLALGYAEWRMKVWEVRVETGELHAILLVDDRILDNRFPLTVEWSMLVKYGYRFHREVPDWELDAYL